jgi:hypothetical protein
MRSILVSVANRQVPNRFLLCQMTAEATRSLHRTATSVHQTINDVLALIGDGKLERSTHGKDRQYGDVAFNPESENMPEFVGPSV